MLKLEIIKKDNFLYNLKSQDGNKYTLNIEFQDIQVNPTVGDYIYLKEDLLNKNYSGYSTCYTFGNLDSKYGKSNIGNDDIDIVKIETNGKELYLKKLYG